METEIKAPRDGLLLAVKVNSGSAVTSGQVLAQLG